jgi:hypothetical protein
VGVLVTSNRFRPPAMLAFHDFRHSVAALDDACTVIRRLWTEDAPFDFDPAQIIRSIHLPVSYEPLDVTREATAAAIAAGFRNVVLGLAAPYPDAIGATIRDELIRRVSPSATAASGLPWVTGGRETPPARYDKRP